MKDISLINAKLFSLDSARALETEFPDIVSAIGKESEYDHSGHVSFLPLNRLNTFAEREECLKIISQVVQTGNFTSGPFIPKVEQLLSEFYVADTTIATSSGTDALKIALKAVDVGMGDEVIVPLNSFAATENAVMAVGATPVFANIDASFNMVPEEVDRLKTSKTKAVLPVCLYGSTRNIAEIHQRAREHSLSVVLDAAQCFGIQSVFSHCDLMALSFNPFKNIGSFGKSGAVLTRSPKLARLSRQYSYHGFAEGKKNIKVQDWGLNSRMDNMQAATLITKLAHFDKNAAKRSFLAARYIFSLEHLGDAISLPLEVYENTWHLFPLGVRKGSRDDLMQYAREHHVELDIYYPVLSHCSESSLARHYPDRKQFRPSECIHAGLLHLPLHNHMSLQEQDSVIEVLNGFFK